MCRFVRLSLSRCTSNHRRYLTCSPTPRTCLYYTHVRRTAYCADLQSILAAAPRTVHITLQSLTLLRRSRSKDLRRKRCHDILSPCGRAVCVGSCRLSAEPRNNHLRFYSSWKTQPWKSHCQHVRRFGFESKFQLACVTLTVDLSTRKWELVTRSRENIIIRLEVLGSLCFRLMRPNWNDRRTDGLTAPLSKSAPLEKKPYNIHNSDW